MDEEEFQSYVDEAVNSLPSEFRDKMENLEIFISDFPSREQLSRNNIRRGTLLGLYEGIPKTRRGHYGIGPTVPDRITIFRYPILMMSHTKAHAIDLIYDTVKHEIAHHFGMDEVTVRKAQQKGRS